MTYLILSRFVDVCWYGLSLDTILGYMLPAWFFQKSYVKYKMNSIFCMNLYILKSICICLILYISFY